MSKGKREKGQGLVEYAMVLPIFLLILFFTIDLSWIVFQKNVFINSCRKTSWNISMPEYEEYVFRNDAQINISGGVVDPYIKEALRDEIIDGGYLNINNVDVSNSSIRIMPGKKVYKYKGPDSVDEKFITKKQTDLEFQTQTLEISSNIKYKVKPLTPIMQIIAKEGIEFDYDLYKIRRGNQRLGNVR